MPLKQVPSVTETDQIAALSDPVQRNLLITQCYFELSSAVVQRTGPRANWCTFATWASKQAGQTIRQEDLARALEHALLDDPGAQQSIDALMKVIQLGSSRHSPDAIRQLLRDAIDPRAAMERAGAEVGRGNQKVFAEIGREFARFAAECLDDQIFETSKIDRFCAGLRPGDPPDGQQYLQQAFQSIYRALFAPDDKKRAEAMLLANLLIGFHEQTRLQPEIAAALEASVVDPSTFSRRLIAVLFPYRGWIIYTGWWILRQLGRPTDLDQAINFFFDGLRHRARLFLTKHLMELTIGHQRLRLSEDLHTGFPEILQDLTLPELLALLQRIDPSPDSTRDSGAVDWADLPDRMHFIADLFRSYQETPAILDPPFSLQQVSAMKAGQMPAGDL